MTNPAPVADHDRDERLLDLRVERDEAVARARKAERLHEDHIAEAVVQRERAAEAEERAEIWEKRWERQTEALARVERVTAAERAVVEAAEDLVTADVEDHEALLMALDRAVAAMQRVRDAQEAAS